MFDPTGIIPAMVTPMTADGLIDERAVGPYVEWLIGQGPVALAVNVDTGEGPHLSRDERGRMLELVGAAARGRVAIVAGVGGPSTRDGEANARQAAAAGADAVLVFPIGAFLSQPLRADVAVGYHEAVAAASGLPTILFQLQPALGGAIYPRDVIDRLLAIPSVVAVKEASFDPIRFTEMRAAVQASDHPVTLLTGNDNFIAESFLLGAEGALLGFATLGTREHVQLLAAARARDMGRVLELGRRLQRLADVIFAAPIGDYRARTKVALRMLGVVPSDAVRPPLLPIDAREVDRIADALAAADLAATALAG
ncbi:MAG: 4-hydroxy-tetrahydrodipicolinate synthase [Chloroflexota bacterium]|jgi:4-hydroxy-tetrahydrodipicolinate synthase|nr:4-hydroxy-tetrahydrodipicolinate synthase [Chloroflexota bacterium]